MDGHRSIYKLCCAVLGGWVVELAAAFYFFKRHTYFRWCISFLGEENWIGLDWRHC